MRDQGINSEDLNRYRNDTAGCSHVVHFNNAGTSLPPNIVVDTVVAYLKEEALYGGYETEHKYHAQIETVYDLIAQLINADQCEIALFENAGTAWGNAFKGLKLEPGDEIITSEMEYTSSVINLIDIRKTGVKVTVIRNALNGNFPLDHLQSAITNRTKLITVAHISSCGGGMLPIEAIGSIAKRHNILYMVDACQSAGQYPLDVKAIGCDILSATGRKYLRGPRGTAFLYVRQEIQNQITPYLADDRGTMNITTENYTIRYDAKRYELYEKSRALTLGFGEAVSYTLQVGIERIWARVQSLAELTREGLRKIPGLQVYDSGDALCGIVTFAVTNIDAHDLRKAIMERGINVSYSILSDTPAYMINRHLKGLVRASVHFYNSEEEIAGFCKIVQEITAPYHNVAK